MFNWKKRRLLLEQLFSVINKKMTPTAILSVTEVSITHCNTTVFFDFCFYLESVAWTSEGKPAWHYYLNAKERLHATFQAACKMETWPFHAHFLCLSMQLQASVSAIVGQVPKKSCFGYLLCVLLLNSCYGHWTKSLNFKKLKVVGRGSDSFFLMRKVSTDPKVEDNWQAVDYYLRCLPSLLE